MSRWKADPAKGWIVLFVLFTIHNLEEVLFDLPGWGREHFEILRGSTISVMDFALAVLAMTVVLVGAAYALRHRHRATVRMQRLFLIIMAANFCWHVGVSLWAGSLQPGVVTSILFLPLFVALERRIPRLAGESVQ